MASTVVTIAGIPLHVVMSNNVAQSRISSQFVQAHFPRKSSLLVADLAVTASLNLMSFTCVLEFLFDPSLQTCDAVLGLDWSCQCHNLEMQCFVDNLKHVEGLGE